MSRCSATSSALERPVTQATRAASQTSLITRVTASSCSVGSAPSTYWSPRSARLIIAVRRMPTTWISPVTVESANMNARVSASVRCGSRCRPRVARVSTKVTRSAGVSPGDGLAAQARLGVLELAGQRGDEQVDLGGEVAVERAEGDVGPLGHGAHLHGVETALGGEGDGGVEDPPAAFTLGRRPELVVGQRVDGGQDLNLPDVISLAPARTLALQTCSPRLPVGSGIIETRSSFRSRFHTGSPSGRGPRKAPLADRTVVLSQQATLWRSGRLRSPPEP